MWLSNFPYTIYWRNCPFPIVYSFFFPHCIFLTLLSQMNWSYTHGFISGLYSVSLPESYYFKDYYSFVIEFEIKKFDVSSFVALSQDAFVSYHCFQRELGRSTQNKNGLFAFWHAERSVQELWCSEVRPSSLPELTLHIFLHPALTHGPGGSLELALPQAPGPISDLLGTHPSFPLLPEGKATDSYSNKVTCDKAPLDNDYWPRNLPLLCMFYGDFRGWVGTRRGL